ncbi:MAG: exodeoxyribonuclease III [Henriciella sp.]|nr:exodeoxyribonuclease III [Henriciella sp.]
MTKDTLRLVSWNINSIRLRLPNVEAFVAAEAPDILCFQEIKCQTAEFPEKAFKDMGLPHLAVFGQKGGHHGVAIASREPLDVLDPAPLCREGHARVNSVKVAGLELHNIYLPAGGDVPDPDENPKFAHKLDFVGRLGKHFKTSAKDGQPRVLVGDLNIAPHPSDVWSHKQLLKIVSHTPVETEALEKARQSGGFTDLARHIHDDDQRLYSWWSYRARDWAASNKGRRLDHIWTNQAATPLTDMDSYRIHLGWRGGWKPSDHAPISIAIKPA